MTAILGISAFYHDSAAAVVVDGRIVAAAQEERFSRIKHDSGFPTRAVEYCLREAGLGPGDVDHVAFYEKPFLKFDRLLETYLATAPFGLRSFAKALPLWVHDKLRLPARLSEGLGGAYRGRYVFPEHHESHAASAFYPSPFEEAAILTVDGVGEWATATLGRGRGHTLEITQEQRFPHSLGLLYSAFTYFCGFRVNSGEYKLMGLAPFGEPRFEAQILERLVDLKEDGSLRLDLSYFDYCAGLTMTSRRFDALFGGAPRRPSDPITQREMDLAASIQKVTETALLRMGRHAHAVTGCENLCLAGGVALNCVANGRLLREGPFRRVWIQPASGDAGGALGAALFVWHQLLGMPRHPRAGDSQEGSLLGPSYSAEAVEEGLRRAGARYRRLGGESEVCDAAAGLLAQGKVVGWVQGRMEFGPRSLGNRSILGDARDPRMQALMNVKIKFRESFRPFAPIVRAERADEYFELSGAESPYMLLVAPVRRERLRKSDAAPGSGLSRINQVRSDIPAVTHIDHSARVQTVDAARNPRLHALLGAFEARTGTPVLVNTSFNIRGEPVVCTPEDAYRCFMATQIDALMIGDFLLNKADQPHATQVDLEAYLGRYGND